MPGCPTVHEHDEFSKVYDPTNTKHKQAVDRVKQYLSSDLYKTSGEKLKGDLACFRSLPRGGTPQRAYYILCEDCKAEVLKKTCSFCKTETHSMNDGVLFYVTDDHMDKLDMKKVNALAAKYKS